jgi:DNA-binding IclR family transcriptional regulator
MAEKKAYRVPAVTRTLDILEYLSKNEEASLTQIHQDLNLAKSTSYGILLTLEDRGYIRKGISGKYQLGLKLYELGVKARERIDYVKEAYPILKELAEKTGLTCNFGVLDGDVAVYLEKIDAPSPIRLNSWKGKRMPLHCTALGKALLAFQNLPETIEILERLELTKLTNRTITDKDTLLSQLLKIKKDGYAIDDQENEIDITCIAVPVFDQTNKAVGAISLSGLASRMTPEKIQETIVYLKLACNSISEKIGVKLPK